MLQEKAPEWKFAHTPHPPNAGDRYQLEEVAHDAGQGECAKSEVREEASHLHFADFLRSARASDARQGVLQRETPQLEETTTRGWPSSAQHSSAQLSSAQLSAREHRKLR